MKYVLSRKGYSKMYKGGQRGPRIDEHHAYVGVVAIEAGKLEKI